MTKYAVWEDDHETQAFPLDYMNIFEISDEQDEQFHEMVDDNATLADLEAQFGTSVTLDAR